MKLLTKRILKILLPFFDLWLRYNKTKIGRTSYWEFFKIKMFGTEIYWYHDKHCTIANTRKIYVGINSFIGRECSYIQGQGGVYVGDYVECGPNIGIISVNHDLYDQRLSNEKPVIIGDYCWIGMNSIINAGVELGTRTIVGAGSVVTKSFPEGYCVLGGVPAKVIKKLDSEKFIPWHEEEEWYGYIPKEKFEKERKKYIDV